MLLNSNKLVIINHNIFKGRETGKCAILSCEWDMFTAI